MNYRKVNNMKKIIVPTGYMGSGSSALTDLLKEYPILNTKNSDFEFVFLHAPNGVFDLENKLLNNNNALRSDEAIKSFRSFMNSLYKYRGWWIAGYDNAVSNNFMKITEEYISLLKTSSFEGSWYIYEKPSTVTWLYRALLNRTFPKLVRRKYPSKMLEFSLITPEKFYEQSNKYIQKIIHEISPEEDFVVLDQFLLPHNLSTIENYKLNNILPIIITRDPRDVFISNKYYWHPRKCGVPFPLNVHEFCRYYKNLRKLEKLHNSNITTLKINFEDLILNYEQSLKIIEDYIGLKNSDHTHKFKYFNPKLSVNNINIFNRKKEYMAEAKIIEKELKEYIYPFPDINLKQDGEIF